MSSYEEIFNKTLLQFLDENTDILQGYIKDLDRMISYFQEKKDDETVRKVRATKDGINSILQQRKHVQ